MKTKKRVVRPDELVCLEVDATHMVVQSKEFVGSLKGKGYLGEHDGYNATHCSCQCGSTGALYCNHAKRVNARLAMQRIEQEQALEDAQSILGYDALPELPEAPTSVATVFGSLQQNTFNLLS